MKIAWEQGQPELSNEQRPPVPPGTYQAKVYSAEMIDSYKGGQTAKIVLEIEKGPHAGRWIWEYFDVLDQQPEKAASARRRLQILARCAGISGRDYSLGELVGAGVQIQTKQVEAKRGPQARVSRFNQLPVAADAAEQFDDSNPISADNLPF